MQNKMLSSEEVRLIHGLRKNPFFRKMLTKVLEDYLEDSADKPVVDTVAAENAPEESIKD